MGLRTKKNLSFLSLHGMENRIIGRFEGEQPGPLLICIGGIHGNEPAGILAMKEVFRLLDKEPASNPKFAYKGTVIGIRGNLPAIERKKRFINRDLNRMLIREDIERFRDIPEESLEVEEKECLALIAVIEAEQKRYNAETTLILDLHTTTAGGGVFSIAAEDEISLSLAKGLHIPVILGIAHGLKGTTIDYFNRPEHHTCCVVFEAGQHDDPESVHRTVSAIINCMRSILAVQPHDVDHRHDGLLMSLSAGLPKVTRLIYHYKIHPGEAFSMHAGYNNFDPVVKGDILAENENGVITSPCTGLILMPKYQPLGDDGFFIVEPVE